VNTKSVVASTAHQRQSKWQQKNVVEAALGAGLLKSGLILKPESRVVGRKVRNERVTQLAGHPREFPLKLQKLQKNLRQKKKESSSERRPAPSE
jgi:hypothetical protein